jgi:hypothetical protein
MVKLQAFAHGILDSHHKGLDIHFEYLTTGNKNLVLTATSRPRATASRQGRKMSYLEKTHGRAKKRVKSGGMATSFREETNHKIESMVTNNTKGQRKCSLCHHNRGHTAFICNLLGEFGESL